MWSVTHGSITGLYTAGMLVVLSGVSVLSRVTLDGTDVKSIHMTKDLLVLDCAFTVATPTEEVTQLTWYRKKKYDRKFREIVQMPIPLMDGKVPRYWDSSLKGRSNVTVIKANYGRTVVRMTVKPECMDEAKYRCEVVVNGGKAPPPLMTTVNILEDPSAISLSQGGAVPEYHQAEFKCSAAVGKPEGDVTWVMTRRTGNHLENITLGGMVTKRMDSRYCSPLAENTLIIEVTGNDETIRCVVTRGAKAVHIEKAVEVQYPARNTRIYSTVNGNKMAYWVEDISAFEGDQIVLNCSSRGRPEPHYTWRFTSPKGGDSVVGLQTLSGSVIYLANATMNLTGTYQCLSTNVVSGVNRNDDAEIRLSIKSKPQQPSDKNTPATPTSEVDKIMAAIGTAAIMAGLIITTICGKCCGS